MPVKNNPTLDALALLAQTIGREDKLRQWFYGLTQKSFAERCQEIYTMTDRMTAEGEKFEIIAALKLLADPNIFSTILETLREHGHVKR